MEITPNYSALDVSAMPNTELQQPKLTNTRPADEKARSYKLTKVNNWDEVREKMKTFLEK